LPHILIVDDEQEMLNNYVRILRRAGNDCRTLESPADLNRHLEDYHPDLVLTDLMMPGGSGLEVLEKVHAFDATIPVIMVTAHGSIENCVEAMKHRAADYLTKPFSMNDLLAKVQGALSTRIMAPVGESTEEDDQRPSGWRRDIIGRSPAMESVFELVRKVARTDVNVLLTGESGTGKEVIARAIHRLSQRRGEIFVPVDCASLPENLLESELFGYSKGAFTGAIANKKGLFEFADKGTLFLDEIGEMPLALQSKLLRVLQERKLRRVGGTTQTDIDVRIITATNRDLVQEVQDKTFRSDLFYRLNVVTIRMPPLRERREDILELAPYFLNVFLTDNRMPPKRISSAAMRLLRQFDWPGNVRELQNVIEHAATLANSDEIGPSDLPAGLRAEAEEIKAAPVEGSGHLFDLKDHMVENFEREYLISLLVDHQFNISAAADAAGCHRRTLYRMIHRHKIELETIKDQRRASRGTA